MAKTAKKLQRMFGQTTGYEVDQFCALHDAVVEIMKKLEEIEARLVAKAGRNCNAAPGGGK